MKKIFVIHGWTYTTSAWDACTSLLEAKGVEVVMLLVPGLTETTDKAWTLEEYVEWLRSKLADEEDVVLVGHSNGGRIALAYMNQYGQNVKKLILIGAAGIVHNEWPLRLKRTLFKVVAKVGKLVIGTGLVRKIFYRLIGAKDYEQAPPHMRETMRNVISVDLQHVFINIRVPTLLLWGRKDTATPLSDAHIMNKEIPNSTLYIIDDAGHSPHKTHPSEVADKIYHF